MIFLSPPVRIELIKLCHGEAFVRLHIFIIILPLGRRWQACTSSFGTFTLYFLFMISVTWSISGQDPNSSSDLMSDGLLVSDLNRIRVGNPLVDAAWFHQSYLLLCFLFPHHLWDFYSLELPFFGLWMFTALTSLWIMLPISDVSGD